MRSARQLESGFGTQIEVGVSLIWLLVFMPLPFRQSTLRLKELTKAEVCLIFMLMLILFSFRLFFNIRENAANGEEAKIVAVDLQAMAPITGVIQIQGDITSVCSDQKLSNWQLNFNSLIRQLVIHCRADNRALRGPESRAGGL